MYHGTSSGSAQSLIKNGWKPNSGFVGGNFGNAKYLYLTNEPENAMWYANESGNDTVVKVSDVPIEFLRPDPEDEAGYTMTELFDRINHPMFPSPSCFISTRELSSDYFSIL